jgi:hypothetical protein
MSISSSSMLVEMHISVWTASKVDRTATDNVTNTANAIKNAAHVKKNLLAGTRGRKDIAEFAQACRVWHNTRTMPWVDKGPRLLPTSLFLDYKQGANNRMYEFYSMRDSFVADYPALIQISHNYLGDLFNPNDYPSTDEVYRKFAFQLVFSPVPESGDFRLDIPSQDLQELKKEYDINFNDRLADAMKDPWDRLHKMLVGISDKLTDKEGDDETKKRYHQSMIDNAMELCGILTHLNVTGDPALEQARRELERAMANADIEVIRDNAEGRADVKQQVDAILKQYKW